MSLDYVSIFNVFVDLCKNAIPIAFFLYLLNIVITLFFSLAFPKHFNKGD